MSFLQRNLEEEEAKRRQLPVQRLTTKGSTETNKPESWHDKPHVKYIIGFLAGVVTSLAFLPQVVKTFKTRTASELTYATLIACLVGQGLWLAYGSATRDKILMIFAVAAFVMYTLLLLSKSIFPASSKMVPDFLVPNP